VAVNPVPARTSKNPKLWISTTQRASLLPPCSNRLSRHRPIVLERLSTLCKVDISKDIKDSNTVNNGHVYLELLEHDISLTLTLSSNSSNKYTNNNDDRQATGFEPRRVPPVTEEVSRRLVAGLEEILADQREEHAAQLEQAALQLPGMYLWPIFRFIRTFFEPVADLFHAKDGTAKDRHMSCRECNTGTP
jgi:hypothetical protein